MTDIARREWGYEGLFVTDWSAMRDQLAAYRAGLDLEMPGTVGSDLDLEEAVKKGTLSEEVLNERAGKVLELLLKSGQKKPALPKNMQAQHLAVERRPRQKPKYPAVHGKAAHPRHRRVCKTAPLSGRRQQQGHPRSS